MVKEKHLTTGIYIVRFDHPPSPFFEIIFFSSTKKFAAGGEKPLPTAGGGGVSENAHASLALILLCEAIIIGFGTTTSIRQEHAPSIEVTCPQTFKGHKSISCLKSEEKYK